jgi:hypothetical protein
MECRWCNKPLVEVDNPMRREVRHRRGEEAACPGPKDLGREAERSTVAGTENGGAPVVDASTDCAPRPPASDPPRLARARAWRDQTAGSWDRESTPADTDAVANTIGWWKDVDCLLVEIDRLKDERDRLQELVAEGQAAYDEVAAERDRLLACAERRLYVEGTTA